METIIKTLQEHAVFCAVFDQIEKVCARLTTAQEFRVLSAVVEGLLARHSRTETELACVALDHVLAQQGKLKRLHQDHQEIDAHFKRVQGAGSLAEAQSQLAKALATSRGHFRNEEKNVFPLIERLLSGEVPGCLEEVRSQEYSTVAA